MMLRFPVQTRKRRTSFMTISVRPGARGGVGRCGSVATSSHWPSVDIGGPNAVSGPAVVAPYFTPKTWTQLPPLGADGSSPISIRTPLPSFVCRGLAVTLIVVSNPPSLRVRVAVDARPVSIANLPPLDGLVGGTLLRAELLNMGDERER